MTGDNLALTSDGLKYTPVAEGEDGDGDQVMPAQSDDRKRLRNSQCAAISTLPSNSMQIILRHQESITTAEAGDNKALHLVGRHGHVPVELKQVLSSSRDWRPLGHNRHGPKVGAVSLFRGSWVPI